MLDLEISEISVTQQIDIPLTEKDTSVITVGMVSSRHKDTQGSLTATFRRVMSPETWLEVCSYQDYAMKKIF